MKGLGLLLIIFEHCTPIGFEYKRWTMSFLMPMFFLLGGYLYRPNSNIWQDIKKSGKRLILPYITGVAIMALIHMFIWHDITWLDGVKWLFSAAGVGTYCCRWLPNWSSIGAFWFFMALFWCRIIFNAVYVKAEKWKYPILSLLAIGGYLLLRYVIRLPLGISEGLSMMVFYLIGHLFRKAQEWYAQMAHPKQHLWGVIGTCALLVVVVLWGWTLKNSEMVCSAGYYKHHLINIICACGITYIYYWFCKGIAEHTSFTARLFTFAGYGSLFLLWIHKLSVHYLFVWPSMFNIQLPADSTTGIVIFLITQWIVCLLLLLIVEQSKVLSDFFGIYHPHLTTEPSIPLHTSKK